MSAWLSNRANWVWQQVAFARIVSGFRSKVYGEYFITEYLVAHQFSDFFLLKSYSAVLELFGIKELDLSHTNQQRGSTDLIQTTSGIAQIFQNPVKHKKGANVK